MKENHIISPKLIELLKTFGVEEFKEFGLFINSPFFNNEAAQMKLYTILKKYYPSFIGRDFSRKKIFQKLYPGKQYNDGITRNLLSRTLHLAEDFLAVKKYRNDEFNFGMNKLHELYERKQTKLFENNYPETINQLEKETYKNDGYYYKIASALEIERGFSQDKKSTLKFDEKLNLEISHNHTVSYMIKMLYINVFTMNAHRHYMHEYEQYKYLMDGIVNHISENYNKYKDITYLNYYYNAYMLAKTLEEKYYYNLQELSNNKLSELSDSDKSNIYSILANYCYTKINKGELGFLKEQFNVYRQSIASGLYIKDSGYISHLFFISIVITGLEAGETAWVKDFIENHKHELDDINMENTYIFCRALFSYWSGDYSKSLDLAAKVKTDDTSYKHQLKSLYLKIHYDLNEVEPFYSHIDNYRHFIASDPNTSDDLRLAIGSYINFSKKLFDYKSESMVDKVGLGMLKQDIINNKAMINKPWLLRKIESLEKEVT